MKNCQCGDNNFQTCYPSFSSFYPCLSSFDVCSCVPGYYNPIMGNIHEYYIHLNNLIHLNKHGYSQTLSGPKNRGYFTGSKAIHIEKAHIFRIKRFVIIRCMDYEVPLFLHLILERGKAGSVFRIILVTDNVNIAKIMLTFSR